jgi:probable HAF family extracellular repeat protein
MIRSLFILLLASLPISAQMEPCTAAHYKVAAVPIVPASVNDSGVIAGTTAKHKAALWSEESGVKEIAIPSGFRIAEGIGINNRGNVIGLATNDSSSKRQAFVYRGGKLVLLSGGESNATAINDEGDVSGEASLSKKEVSSAVVWMKSAPVDLGGCCGGTATTLNNHGQVAGQIYDDQGRYSAFLWDQAHGLQRIGPPNTFSSAVTINDSGHIVIQEFTRHGVFLYADGKLTPLDLSPKFPSRPRAMNRCDAIVGSFGPFADVERAFVWDPARGFRDLNDLIPGDSGWKLEAATGINSKGEIVGRGDYKHNDDAGFLLIPEP